LDTSQTRSLDRLKKHFERLQLIRRVHVDDFELQVMVADIHQEIIERARYLREEAPVPATGRDEASRLFPREQVALFTEKPPVKTLPAKPDSTPAADEPSDAAEIPPEVPRLDSKSWQLAVGLALFLTVLVLAAFFYLIQTARKINFKDQETATAAAAPPEAGKPSTATVALPAAASPTPTLRLYTDLLPGTVSFDGQPPRNLNDGEFVLDNLQPGRHSVNVAGRGGVAAFDFEVTGKGAPQVIGTPTASNAMAVLVSQEDGRGRLVTNAEHSAILLDGKPAGEVGAQGLPLEALGKTEHDLQVTQDRDHQRFVLTYTPAPTLTVYVKSDPNVGTVVVMAGQDGADVYIDEVLYRRKTEHGQLRIPLKAGKHNIRVHKAGFTDPPPMVVEVKKSEETAASFTLKTAPEVLRAAASTSTVATPEQTAAEKKEPAALPPAETPPPVPAAVQTPHLAASDGLPVEGEQVRRGGGFVSYHVPRAPGRYSFQARGRVGGFLKHGKLQWYAGYQDNENYILFTLDGKHANIREVRQGKSIEWNRVPFAADSNDWVQVDLAVKANSISARVKNTNGAWTDIGDVNSPGRDFTQDKVGFYIPTNDEVAIANFRFSNH
jgi:hypothetical protein